MRQTISSDEILAERLDPAAVCSYTREVLQRIRIPDSGTMSHIEVSANRRIIQVDQGVSSRHCVEPAADWQPDKQESHTWDRTQESHKALLVSIYIRINALYKFT